MSADNERPTPGQENEIDVRSILVARFVDEILLPKVDWLEDESINDEVSAKVDINLKNILEDFIILANHLIYQLTSGWVK